MNSDEIKKIIIIYGYSPMRFLARAGHAYTFGSRVQRSTDGIYEFIKGRKLNRISESGYGTSSEQRFIARKNNYARCVGSISVGIAPIEF